MALKYIRILTKATPDNPGAYPIMFDVVLDTKTGRIALDDEILGRQWGLNEYDYPFVVKTNGDVTFGDEVKCEWARTDVRDVVLKVGSVILWEGDGGYHEFFRVIELRDMLARAK